MVAGRLSNDSQRSSPRTPNFRRISTHHQEREFCAPAEACHADSSISAFGRISREHSTEMMLKPQPELPGSSATWRTEPEEEELSRRLPEQFNALVYQEERAATEGVWRSNYSSLAGLADMEQAVMDDQAERGQILRLTEEQAKARYPNLAVASLGANKKEKSTGESTARVLFDGTHGIDVNRRIRVRDQERGPIAAGVKRFLREKARYGRRDGCPQAGLALCRSTDTSSGLGIREHSRDLRNRVCILLVVKSCRCDWKDRSVHSGKLAGQSAVFRASFSLSSVSSLFRSRAHGTTLVQ